MSQWVSIFSVRCPSVPLRARRTRALLPSPLQGFTLNDGKKKLKSSGGSARGALEPMHGLPLADTRVLAAESTRPCRRRDSITICA